MTKALINRGDVLLRLNRTQDAQDSYRTALRYDDNNPDIYYNVSVSIFIICVSTSIIVTLMPSSHLFLFFFIFFFNKSYLIAFTNLECVTKYK